MAAFESKPKGILKKPSINFQQKNRLKWDEDNIQLTESQKNSTMKITEPKTPYIHYNQETDEIMTDLQTIPGLILESNSRESLPSGSLSSVSPSSAHFPDSVKDDWDSDGSEDEETKEKRRKFAQLRAKHYNMKEALSIGHKLAKLTKNQTEDNSDNNDSSSNVLMET